MQVILGYVLPTPQKAKMVKVPPAVSAKAEKLFKALQAAQKDWEDFNKEVADTYLTTACILDQTHQNPKAGNRIAPNNKCALLGWDGKHQFSDDWEYLVPDTLMPSDVSGCWKIR